MSFVKNKYCLVRKTVSKELSQFVYEYFKLKRDAYDALRKYNFISPFETIVGSYESANDQIPNTFCQYGDAAMETLLLRCLPQIEKSTGLKLYPSYAYARIYKKGDILKRHKDRFSCEISATLNLGGDPWPIFLSPNKNVGVPNNKDITAKSNFKGISLTLQPGDMLLYKGTELEHWREKFQGDHCVQVFFHYNNQKTPGALENKFDLRPNLGIPIKSTEFTRLTKNLK
tara:strand:+ start:2871 stop:3557 length:687 start_codon:yes stop_codon:yes gene_type:complete